MRRYGFPAGRGADAFVGMATLTVGHVGGQCFPFCAGAERAPSLVLGVPSLEDFARNRRVETVLCLEPEEAVETLSK